MDQMLYLGTSFQSLEVKMLSFLIPFDCSNETSVSFLFCLYYFSVDEAFPSVTFDFEESLNLTIYPHEYLFQIRVSNVFKNVISYEASM